MTGRERVKAALEFRTPDRVPRDLWALPYIGLFRKAELEAVLARYPRDFASPELSPGTGDNDTAKLAQAGTYVDDWGSVWHLAEPGIVGEVKGPALDDWSKLATFQPPWRLVRQRDFSHVNRVCDQSDKFMISGVTARPFERLQFLRGSEALFLDLAGDVPELRRLIDMVHEFFLADVTAWAKTNVDAVLMMDDWGTNNTLLIHPEMWRAIFKPLYREYCKIVHQHGKFAFFHSDGHIEAIYGDLIEVGMDAINSQLFCMNIEALAEKYKGKVTFWGELDRQHILPFGTPEDVRRAVHRVRRALGDPRGGVIAQCEWGKDNPQANVEAVFAAWEEAR